MAANLVDLLRQAKPERVLFTTFTLSLSWFEAFVLPTISRDKAPQIDLIVDERYYRRLCRDSESAFAGTAFRISPARMRSGGFFHPKIAYLQTADPAHDILVVSSGNLTASGQGGNLEVIDAVCVSDHPHVFREFSAFCSTLPDAVEMSEKVALALQHFSRRAEEAFAAVPESARTRRRTAWLVHTLKRPALAQLAARVNDELAEERKLTVLSPYHTPTGQTIGELAEACGIRSTQIALARRLVGAERSQVFDIPFQEKAPKLPDGLCYVVERSQLSRVNFAHAKCFEVAASDSVIVMTGSVNATQQSLAECRNAEVSIIRRLSASPFDWKIHKPASHRPSDFTDIGEAISSGIVDASLIGGRLAGQLRPCKAAGTAKVEMWCRDERYETVDKVEVTATGHFEFNLEEPDTVNSALLIKLLHNGVELGCGWVNVEAILAKMALDGLANARHNISQRKGADADYLRVISHFKQILNAPPALKSLSGGEPGGPRPSPPKIPRPAPKKAKRSLRNEMRGLLLQVLLVAPNDETALEMLRDSVHELMSGIAQCARPLLDRERFNLRQWLNMFTRPQFTEKSPAWLKDLYYGVASAAVHFAPDLFNEEILRRDIERVLGSTLTESDWSAFPTRTLKLPEFAALADVGTDLHKEAALSIVTAPNASAMLEVLLRARLGDPPYEPQPVRESYRDLDSQLQKIAQQAGKDLSRKGVIGLLPDGPQYLHDHTPCPLCNVKLQFPDLVEQLRRTGFGLHKPGCEKLLAVGVSCATLIAAGVPAHWVAELNTRENA